MAIEVVTEPPPPPRASGKPRVEVRIHFLDSKRNNEVVAVRSSHAYQNERRMRETRKY
jgi:hypothetical protein